MTDTPSSILLLRLQSTGSNTNLWGGYLNTALQTLEQAAKGYQALAVTADATISWTNYATGNTGQVAALKLTGTLSSAAALTFPSYQNFIFVWNAAGAAVTVKCSGGTGVSIPNGRKVLLFCDGVDYTAATPTYTSDTVTLTNGGDLVNYTALQTAISTLLSGTVTGLVLNSAADTTAGYLSGKITGTGAVTISTTSAGGNEKTNIAVGAIGLTLQAAQSASFAAVAGNLYPVDCTAAGRTVTLPSATGTFGFIGLAKFGLFPMTLSGTVNGSASGLIITDEGLLNPIMDSGASRGWV